jgi:ABC-type transporter Mla subunit MlaD
MKTPSTKTPTLSQSTKRLQQHTWRSSASTSLPKESSVTTKAAKSKSTTEEARSITQSLRRTQALLAQELERVSHVTDVIDQDGQLLERTAAHHHQLKSTVQDAGSALRTLKYQKRKAAIIWWTSITVYTMVVLYILFARLRIPFLLW